MPSARPAGPAFVCTMIGCDSQVVFKLTADLVSAATYQVEACIDGACESASVRIPPRDGAAVGVGSNDAFTIDPTTDVVAFVLDGGDYSGPHQVSLRVAGDDLEPIEVAAETEFERSQPNGPNCEPVCWQATVRM